MSEANPFASLGAPPGNDDPKGQLEYLIRCVNAFTQQKDPRVRPLREKLFLTLAELKPNPTDEEKALMSVRLAAVQIETYELMAVVINQIRAALRAQLGRGMPTPKRLDTERLQRELASFAHAVRKLVSALKTGNDAKRREATAALDGVAQYGNELNSLADDSE